MTNKIQLDLTEIGLGVCAPVEAAAPKKAQEKDYDPSEFGVPLSVALMIQPTVCIGCGEEYEEHQGVCLEVQFRAHKLFRHMDTWEMHLYHTLPRRLEYKTAQAIEFCKTCFLLDRIIQLVNEQPQKAKMLSVAEELLDVPVIASSLEPLDLSALPSGVDGVAGSSNELSELQRLGEAALYSEGNRSGTESSEARSGTEGGST